VPTWLLVSTTVAAACEECGIKDRSRAKESDKRDWDAYGCSTMPIAAPSPRQDR